MNFYKASKKKKKQGVQRDSASPRHMSLEICGLVALRCDSFPIFGGGKCRKGQLYRLAEGLKVGQEALPLPLWAGLS